MQALWGAGALEEDLQVMRPDLNPHRDAFGLWCSILCAACLAWLLWDCHLAQGQDHSLTLAQIGKLECDPTHHPDCYTDMVAIWYVGLARYDNPTQGLLSYSSLMTRTNPRAKAIRNLTHVSRLPTRKEQVAWHRALWLARRVIAGAVKNPCPGATHWGGAMDAVPAHWVRINCPTRNRFYRVGK